MTRAHVRSIVAIDQSAWPLTFTLKELMCRSIDLLPATEGFASWVASAGSVRRTADMLKPAAEDDVIDPYRRGRAANVDMVITLDRLSGELLQWGPWKPN